MDVLVTLEELDEVGDVLGGEAELVGGEHEGMFEPVGFAFDFVFGDELGDASGGGDDEGVALAGEEAFDTAAVFEVEDVTFESVGDVGVGIDDGAGDDVLGLSGTPAFEVGSVVDALAVELVAHDAAGGGGFSFFGIAGELEDVLHGEFGLAVFFDVDGGELDICGVVNAAVFQGFGDVVLFPFAGAVAEEPVGGVGFGEIVVGEFEHGFAG